jgi:HK97 family phage portal protein
MGSRLNELVDVAWMCLDRNASALSTMPVYRTRDGQIVSPEEWMTNPDPSIYTSWHEFAKQLFWDYQLGEAFVLPMAHFSDGLPMRFRVIPPWLIHVEMRGGNRVYRLGGMTGTDVTADILHIRYKSTTDSPHGVGPLESAGGRMLTAGVLAKYVREVVSTGGVPSYTLETAELLDQEDAEALLEGWIAARQAHLGLPAVLDNGVTLKTHQSMTPKQMAMLEIAQFTEARIAELLGVPAFLVGLPSGDSMTYSNVSSLFDYHDRASLRPKAAHVMSALSGWSLPPGEAAELNRDEYTRPAFAERATAWVALKGAGLVTDEQFQAAERLHTPRASAALTDGGDVRSSGPITASPREIAEMIQKIYLGVGVVLSPEEARDILNRAGAGLDGSAPTTPALAAPPTGGDLP